jgi:hypothetical protein
MLNNECLTVEERDNNKKFTKLQISKFKAFKYKKIINELPVIEILKRRVPKIYKEEMNCPRCNRKGETLQHLWECVDARNDIIHIEKIAKEKLHELIVTNDNLINKDVLEDEIYKFTRTKCTLRESNTEENVKIYKILKPFDKRRTYIWDGNGSLDQILMGWIPSQIIDIVSKYQRRKNRAQIRKLILEWSREINWLFFKNIWCKRNEKMIQWEKDNNISLAEKRQKNVKKNIVRERNKRKITGKRNTYYHVVNEELYKIIKKEIGLDFQNSLNIRVGFYVVTCYNVLVLDRNDIRLKVKFILVCI